MNKAEKKPAGKKKTLYNRPEKIAPGTALKDLLKNQWEIIEEIGSGGFGDIYSAKKCGDTKKKQLAEYAIKVEPKENGPLFTEIHFYMKFFKSSVIDEWKKENNRSFLGVPTYYGSGSFVQDGVDQRFLVMDRFGPNIRTRLYSDTAKKVVNCSRLFQFVRQVIDSLHYIHSKNYAHGDVKAENLLLKYNSTEDQVFLIDYGLVTTCYKSENIVIDKKKQHNGTLLYCSRDAHLGIVTKRGDLEALAFNVLSWFNYKLPWSEDTKAESVQEKKIHFMDNLTAAINQASEIPKSVFEFLQYVNTLDHLQTPDYEKIAKLFSQVDPTPVANSAGARKPIKKTSAVNKNVNEHVTKKIKRDKPASASINCNGASSDSSESRRVTRSSKK